MSEEKRQNLNVDEDGNDNGGQIENVEDETGVPEARLNGVAQNSSNLPETTAEALLNYVAQGTEVRPGDVLITEELSNDTISDDNLEYSIIYDLPPDNRNGNSHLPEVCSFSPDTQELLELPGCLKLQSSRSVFKTNRDRDVKNESFVKSPSPLTQVIGVNAVQESQNLFECADYASDEFADIEDNVKESSSSDINDSTPTGNDSYPTPLKAPFPIKRKNDGSNDLQSTSSLSTSSSSEDTFSENEPVVNGLNRTTPIPLPNSTFEEFDGKTGVKTPDGSKKLKTFMSTIEEVPETEKDDGSDITERPQQSQPSTSGPNPLKMRAKVGKRKDRCHVCNARLPITAFSCRCGGYYCSKHRYDKEHGCTYDYKSAGAEEIRKNNPKVAGEKVRKL